MTIGRKMGSEVGRIVRWDMGKEVRWREGQGVHNINVHNMGVQNVARHVASVHNAGVNCRVVFGTDDEPGKEGLSSINIAFLYATFTVTFLF